MKNPKPEPSTRRCFRRATKRVEARAANHLIHYEPRFPSSALEDFEFFWHLKHRDLQLRIWGVGATCHRLLTSLRLRKRLVYFNIQDLCASVVKAFWGFRVLGLRGSTGASGFLHVLTIQSKLMCIETSDFGLQRLLCLGISQLPGFWDAESKRSTSSQHAIECSEFHD